MGNEIPASSGPRDGAVPEVVESALSAMRIVPTRGRTACPAPITRLTTCPPGGTPIPYAAVPLQLLARASAVLWLIIAWGVTPVESHDLSHSQSTIVATGREARVSLQLDLVGLGGLQWRGRDVVTYDELDARVEHVADLIREHFSLTTSSALVSRTVIRYDIVDGHGLMADLLFTFERDIDTLTVGSTLDRVTNADHQHLATVTINGASIGAILSAGVPEATFDGRRSPWASTWRLVRGGVLRVLTGADSLGFLLLLLVAKPTARSLVVALIAAMAAVTVGVELAAWNVVVFSPAWLPTLVPMVIAALALANLLGGHEMDRAIVVSAFAFVQTLVHAQNLRATGALGGSQLLGLTAFSLGVMATQVMVVALVFPLARMAVSDRRYVRPTVSVAVACAAAYWIVERSFSS